MKVYNQKLPSKWNYKKIKYLSQIKTGSTPSSSTPELLEGDYTWFTPSDFTNEIVLKKSKRTINEEAIKKGVVPKYPPYSTLLVGIGATIGKIGYTITEASSNQQITALIPLESEDCRFFNYAMRSNALIIRNIALFTTLPIINNFTIGSFELAFPEQKNDQIAIADYLDQKTVNISLQIEKIQKMIELLKEKKEVLIINAVTKGLDPNVPMKDSGIDWIGEIPEHWEVKKIKNLFSVYNGATPKSDNDAYWDGDIIWVTPADYATSDTYISDSKRKITYEGLTSCATKIVPENSIIVSNRAPIGAIALASKPLCTNQGCKTLVKKANAQIYEKYIYYYLSTQQDILNMLGKGTTFLELSSYDLSSFSIPFPQIEVQISISNYLDEKISYINGIISINQKLIKKLTEYQEALITAAVTGKIDVRGE